MRHFADVLLFGIKGGEMWLCICFGDLFHGDII